MENTLTSIQPWCPVILKDHFDGLDWASLSPKVLWLFDQIKQNSSLERDGGLSSVTLQNSAETQPHMWAEFAKLQEWLNPKINQAISTFKLTEQPYQVTNSWINKHPTGSWTDEHTHRGCSLVIVVYLKVPENSGRLMFRDPLEYHWSTEPSDFRQEQNGPWYPVDVKAGDVFFFPGWLNHKTEKNYSNEDRYVMSINLTGLVTMKNLVEMGVLG